MDNSDFPQSKRLEEVIFSYRIRVLTEALRIVDGNREALDDNVFNQAVANVRKLDLEETYENIVSERKNLAKQFEAQKDELFNQMDSSRRTLESEIESLRQANELLRKSVDAVNTEKHIIVEQINSLETELDNKEALLQNTQELFKKNIEQHGITKQDLITTKKRLRMLKREMIRMRGEHDQTKKLLYQAQTEPQKTTTQKITGLFIKLAGGLAFTTGLVGTITSIAAGDPQTALAYGTLAAGGFGAGAAVEVNIWGLFGPKNSIKTVLEPQTSNITTNDDDLTERIAHLADDKKQELLSRLDELEDTGHSSNNS